MLELVFIILGVTTGYFLGRARSRDDIESYRHSARWYAMRIADLTCERDRLATRLHQRTMTATMERWERN